jgi:hypothetical protein
MKKVNLAVAKRIVMLMLRGDGCRSYTLSNNTRTTESLSVMKPLKPNVQHTNQNGSGSSSQHSHPALGFEGVRRKHRETTISEPKNTTETDVVEPLLVTVPLGQFVTRSMQRKDPFRPLIHKRSTLFTNRDNRKNRHRGHKPAPSRLRSENISSG